MTFLYKPLYIKTIYKSLNNFNQIHTIQTLVMSGAICNIQSRFVYRAK